MISILWAKLKIDAISLFFVTLTVLMMSSGLTATTSKSYAAVTTLPTCTDPTGQNLPCMIVISTLPPPSNAIQCRETSGQILPCSYATQNLSTGQQIVAITVYVPVNFEFSSPTVIKVVVRETTGATGGGTDGIRTTLHKLLVVIGIAKDPIVRGNKQTISVTVSDSKNPDTKIPGVKLNGEVDYASHKTTKTFFGVTDGTGQMSPPYSWQIGGNSDNGTFTVKAKATKTGYSDGSAIKTFRVLCKFVSECGHMINQTNNTIPNNGTISVNGTQIPGGSPPVNNGTNGTQQIFAPTVQPTNSTSTSSNNHHHHLSSPPNTGSNSSGTGSQPTHKHHESKHKKSTSGAVGSETTPSSPGPLPNP